MHSLSAGLLNEASRNSPATSLLLKHLAIMCSSSSDLRPVAVAKSSSHPRPSRVGCVSVIGDERFVVVWDSTR